MKLDGYYPQGYEGVCMVDVRADEVGEDAGGADNERSGAEAYTSIGLAEAVEHYRKVSAKMFAVETGRYSAAV